MEMQIVMKKDELLDLIKQAVREVLEEETMELILRSLPTVSREEMEEIEKLYGKPSEKEEVAYIEEIEI